MKQSDKNKIKAYVREWYTNLEDKFSVIAEIDGKLLSPTEIGQAICEETETGQKIFDKIKHTMATRNLSVDDIFKGTAPATSAAGHRPSPKI